MIHARGVADRGFGGIARNGVATINSGQCRLDQMKRPQLVARRDRGRRGGRNTWIGRALGAATTGSRNVRARRRWQ